MLERILSDENVSGLKDQNVVTICQMSALACVQCSVREFS